VGLFRNQNSSQLTHSFQQFAINMGSQTAFILAAITQPVKLVHEQQLTHVSSNLKGSQTAV